MNCKDTGHEWKWIVTNKWINEQMNENDSVMNEWKNEWKKMNKRKNEWKNEWKKERWGCLNCELWITKIQDYKTKTL